MIKGSWVLTGSASQEIIAANEYREYLMVQSTGSAATYFAFGEDAVDGEGVRLVKGEDSFTVKGALARLAVHAIGTQTNSAGCYQEGNIEVNCHG